MQQATPYGTGSGAGRDPGSGTGGPGPGTLTAGARVTGALICVVLIGVELAWAIRDFDSAGVHDTLWTWFGLQLPGIRHGLLGTSGLDAVLLVVLVGALAAARRPSAGWAFVTVGLFAVAYRVPGVWIFTSDWARDAPLHDRALSTSVGYVIAGVALIVTGLAGRRPAGAVPLTGPSDQAYSSGPAGPYQAPVGYGTPAVVAAPAGPGAPPARPRTGAAFVGGLVAVALALELAGWQFYYVQEYHGSGFPPHLYRHLLTGQETITSLLAAPTYYAAWITVVLCLLLAVAAFTRAPLARPLGLAVGATFVLNGVISLDNWHTEKLLFHSGIPDNYTAQQSFDFVELIFGLLLLGLMGLREPRTAGSSVPPAWGSPTGYGDAPGQGGANPYGYGGGGAHGQAAGNPSGYGTGYGSSSGGWGGSPQQQPPAAPGGFGPPPNLPPDLPPRPPQQPPAGYGYPSYPPGEAPPPPAGPPQR
ncbi:hypothetical protein [Actinacidiphila acididurans]|uniref:Uncharacterized protein n=1 Tax=Actinacidiphila acididurans TaxID=2784346 RepID=A0ABS2TXD7_9ACTN|nr:hypothetical protein [Actinacidiphila acididurans]MBM9507747.1 hypothetical protein [Actinacidiphila acididurans]